MSTLVIAIITINNNIITCYQIISYLRREILDVRKIGRVLCKTVTQREK